MLDDLVAARPATFQWLLHAHERIEIDGRALRIRRDPAAMAVHLLLPEELSITQTDKYDPEPEYDKAKGTKWENTWHLTAATKQPAGEARFLSVLLVHKKGTRAKLPEVRLVKPGEGVGVLLTWPDGALDRVAFRGVGEVAAEGRDRAGKLTRSLTAPAATP
jgi:hypothetical protein